MVDIGARLLDKFLSQTPLNLDFNTHTALSHFANFISEEHKSIQKEKQKEIDDLYYENQVKWGKLVEIQTKRAQGFESLFQKLDRWLDLEIERIEKEKKE